MSSSVIVVCSSLPIFIEQIADATEKYERLENAEFKHYAAISGSIWDKWTCRWRRRRVEIRREQHVNPTQKCGTCTHYRRVDRLPRVGGCSSSVCSRIAVCFRSFTNKYECMFVIYVTSGKQLSSVFARWRVFTIRTKNDDGGDELHDEEVCRNRARQR